ncbi:hypothetical protein Cni_G09230 [Canna indica]|uniref:Transmembrane protein n=1 Tax=Canna indica TaxID=4628 RepID=A0AAQ3K249_9LILI|nr:hypothetical protein Cni_G09230 [Canna indica]
MQAFALLSPATTEATMSLLPPTFAIVKCRPLPPSFSCSSSVASYRPFLLPINNIVDSRLLMAKEGLPFKPRPTFFTLALRPLSVSSTTSFADDPSSLSVAVGPPPCPPLSRWNLDRRHILLLNFTACAAAISAAWLLFSAIPTILAFKKAAESLEKLMDVTADELPDTMAAVRLSGMEISDLTMELSDLGQEITQGVKSSTRAVRVAEDRLRHPTTMSPTIMVQGKNTPKNETHEPKVAKTARNLREGIVNGRVAFGLVFSLTQVSRWAINFLTSRGGKRSS